MGLYNQRVTRQFGSLFAPQDSLQNYQDYAEPSDASRYYSDVRNLYAHTPALDAYRQYISSAPNPDDYRPTKWDRLTAGLAGFSTGLHNAGAGIQVAQSMNRSRYQNALDDFYQGVQPLQAAANLERQNISDQSRYIMDANELGLKYDDYKRQVWKNQADVRNKGRELDLEADKNAWNKTYQGKRLEQFDRDANSLQAYRTGMVGVARQNAGTNAFNAQTNRMNANTNTRNVNSLIDYRGDEGLQGWAKIGIDRQRAANQHNPSGTDLQKFQQDELSNLKAKYPKFISMDDNGDYVLDQPPDVSSSDYQSYQGMVKELQNRINYRAQFGRVNFGAGNDSNDDWELVGEQ